MTIRASRSFCILAITLLLVGCAALNGANKATLPPPPPSPPWIRGDMQKNISDTESLLIYLEYIKRMSKTALRHEYENVKLTLTQAKTEFNMMRQALLLSLPNSGFNDDVRALENLESIVKNSHSQLRPLASVIYSYLAEEQMLEERVRNLEGKIEALKMLERSLSDRDGNKTH